MREFKKLEQIKISPKRINNSKFPKTENLQDIFNNNNNYKQHVTQWNKMRLSNSKGYFKYK